jgi:hypothetical protein
MNGITAAARRYGSGSGLGGGGGADLVSEGLISSPTEINTNACSLSMDTTCWIQLNSFGAPSGKIWQDQGQGSPFPGTGGYYKFSPITSAFDYYATVDSLGNIGPTSVCSS